MSISLYSFVFRYSIVQDHNIVTCLCVVDCCVFPSLILRCCRHRCYPSGILSIVLLFPFRSSFPSRSCSSSRLLLTLLSVVLLLVLLFLPTLFIVVVLRHKQIIVITRRVRSIDPSLYCVVRYLFASLYVSFLFLFLFLFVFLLLPVLLPLPSFLWWWNQYLIGFERTSLAGRPSIVVCRAYPSLIHHSTNKSTK